MISPCIRIVVRYYLTTAIGCSIIAIVPVDMSGTIRIGGIEPHRIIREVSRLPCCSDMTGAAYGYRLTKRIHTGSTRYIDVHTYMVCACIRIVVRYYLTTAIGCRIIAIAPVDMSSTIRICRIEPHRIIREVSRLPCCSDMTGASTYSYRLAKRICTICTGYIYIEANMIGTSIRIVMSRVRGTISRAAAITEVPKVMGGRNCIGC